MMTMFGTPEPRRLVILVGVFLLTFATFIAGCAGGPQRPPSGVPAGDTSYMQSRLRYEMQELMDEHELASLSVSVVNANGPLFEHTLGIADKATHSPATLNTPYRWGSNSKVFVMLALLQLERAGRVDLDAPLTTYLPEFSIGPPPSYFEGSASWKLDDITLRRMLTHHSGLPGDLLPLLQTGEPEPFQNVLKRLPDEHAAFPVDFISAYSNLAFGLLGIVIERASGESFDNYMARHMFKPAAMTKASFAWTPYLDQHVAHSYDATGALAPRRKITQRPAGSLMASTREMGLFASALLRGGMGNAGPIVDKAILDKSFQIQNANVPLDFDDQRGLAWFLRPLPEKQFGFSAAHGGGLPHHYSAFILLPESQLAVVVVSNSQNGVGVVKAMARRTLQLALESKTGKPPIEDEEVIKVAPAEDPSPAELYAWEGHYATVFGDIELHRDGDQLETQLFGKPMFVRPLTDGTVGLWTEFWGLFEFRPDALAGRRFKLEHASGQTVVVVVDRYERSHFFAARFKPVAAPAKLRYRAGTYLHPGRGDSWPLKGFTLFVAPSGVMMVRPIAQDPVGGLPPEAALKPMSDGSLIVEGLGRNHGTRFSFDKDGALHVSGARFVKQRAHKVEN